MCELLIHPCGVQVGSRRVPLCQQLTGRYIFILTVLSVFRLNEQDEECMLRQVFKNVLNLFGGSGDGVAQDYPFSGTMITRYEKR